MQLNKSKYQKTHSKETWDKTKERERERERAWLSHLLLYPTRKWIRFVQFVDLDAASKCML